MVEAESKVKTDSEADKWFKDEEKEEVRFQGKGDFLCIQAKKEVKQAAEAASNVIVDTAALITAEETDIVLVEKAAMIKGEEVV